MKQCVVWILLCVHPALTAAEAFCGGRDGARVVLVESQGRLGQLPYQRKKIVLILSAMRHYAEQLREQGYIVDYLKVSEFQSGLGDYLRASQPDQVLTMAASEYRTRDLQHSLGAQLDLPVVVLPNTQFLTAHYHPYPDPIPGKRYVMENFYRAMRRYFQVLMEDDQPTGGEWNYDKHNRESLPKGLPLPELITFTPDVITQEVMGEVLVGVGTAEGFTLAVTHAQAQAALQEFITERLPAFGAYEDAMTQASRTLFHSLLSPYLNIGLLEPLPMIRAAEMAYREGKAPLNSVEGFIRQILGWREYIYWQYWLQMPGLQDANHWQADRVLPQFFWDSKTEMNCLQHVVKGLLETGYSHHIERLMIVCNFCLLAGISPQAVADWFLILYIDAYEWVVLPNVIGMGLNADGGQTATKPYIASANYINKMSNYCQNCYFDPKKRTGETACPYNFLYWNFLIEHEVKLRANPRLGPNILGLSRVSEAERQLIQGAAQVFLMKLAPRD